MRHIPIPMLRLLGAIVCIWAVLGPAALVAKASETDNPFWNNGEPFFEVQEIFTGQRFPDVVVAMDGTVIVFRCQNNRISLRRSEDGGATWGPIITTSETRHDALGAAVVDENTGDILVFPDFIVAESTMYRSRDHGKTWTAEEVERLPDGFGGVGVTHGGESGITLLHGPKKGRLLLAARVFGPQNSNALEWRHYCYNTAIYSDDGGRTWQTSGPFPELGTGEGTLAELSNGHIYYNSRNHMAPNTMRRSAWSYDGGEVWTGLQTCDTLPDGPRDDPYGCKGGIVRLPVDGHDILIFSNLDSPSGRRRGTVWASFDGGRTWPVKRLAYPGPCAYSSLNAGRAGTPSEGYIYMAIEGGEAHMYAGIQVVRFNLAWLTEGQDWHEFLP